MIQANELRLGNIIDADGEITRVKNIYHDSVDIKTDRSINPPSIRCVLYKYIKPIPITVEFFIKNGFKKELCGDYYRLGDIVFWFAFSYKGINLKNKKYFAILMSGMNEVSKPIYYVHNIQNIYFALTGEELTKK